MRCISRTDCEHGCVSYNSGQATSKSCPNSLQAAVVNQWLALDVDQIRPPKLLCVAVQDGWHNVIPKQSKIPVIRGISTEIIKISYLKTSIS